MISTVFSILTGIISLINSIQSETVKQVKEIKAPSEMVATDIEHVKNVFTFLKGKPSEIDE